MKILRKRRMKNGTQFVHLIELQWGYWNCPGPVPGRQEFIVELRLGCSCWPIKKSRNSASLSLSLSLSISSASLSYSVTGSLTFIFPFTQFTGPLFFRLSYLVYDVRVWFAGTSFTFLLFSSSNPRHGLNWVIYLFLAASFFLFIMCSSSSSSYFTWTLCKYVSVS